MTGGWRSRWDRSPVTRAPRPRWRSARGRAGRDAPHPAGGLGMAPHGWVVFLIALCCCSGALGEVRISLPLQGHYRVGRYMPVRIRAVVEGAPRGATVQLRGSGLLTTSIALNEGRADGVVPALVLQSPLWHLQWEGPDQQGHALSLPLHELTETQRLVGLVDVDRAAAETLLGGKGLIAVRLEPEVFFSAPASAWSGLDAVVLTPAAYGRLAPAQRQVLLAGGVALAVWDSGSTAAPDAHWPWKKQPGGWIVRPIAGGPAGAGFSAAAYRPTYSWAAGWPAAFRAHIALAAVAFSLVVLLAMLLPGRWTLPLVLVIVAVAMTGFGIWRRDHSPLLHVDGTVHIDADGMVQRDHWFYQAAADVSEGGFAFADLTYPIFADAAHAAALHPRLVCRNDGRPAWIEYHLPHQARIALLTRSVVPDGASVDLQPARPSGLRALVQALYLTPGHVLAGQTSAPDATWPTLIVQQHR